MSTMFRYSIQVRDVTWTRAAFNLYIEPRERRVAGSTLPMRHETGSMRHFKCPYQIENFYLMNKLPDILYISIHHEDGNLRF